MADLYGSHILLACWWAWTLSYAGCSDERFTTTVMAPKGVAVELPCLVGSPLAGQPFPFKRGWWERNGQDQVVRQDSSGRINISAGYGVTDDFALIVNTTGPGTWTYKCTVINDTVNILRSQLTMLVVTDDDIEVINRSSGHDVKLFCPADEGSLVTWYKGINTPKQAVVSPGFSSVSGSQFTIPSASESDSGIYICNVTTDNQAPGNRKLKYFFLSVTESETSWLLVALVIGLIPCIAIVVAVIIYKNRMRNTRLADPETPDVCQYTKVGNTVPPRDRDMVTG